MVMKNRKEYNMDGVDVDQLSHLQLLKFVKRLQNKFEKEHNTLIHTQLDRDQTHVFLKLTNDKLNKLKLDVVEMLKISEDTTKELFDLKNLVRVQDTKYRLENIMNINECNLRNQKSIQQLTKNCRLQTDMLMELNSSLEKMLYDKTLLTKSREKHVDLKRNERKITRINKMEADVIGFLDEIETEFMISHVNSMENKISFKKTHEKMLVDYNDKMMEMVTSEMDKRKEALFKNDILQRRNRDLHRELESVEIENQQMTQQLQELTEENEKLIASEETHEKRIQTLERKLRICKPSVNLNNDYKRLYDLKVYEYDELEKENANIRENFQKYDECLIDVLIDLKEQYYLNGRQQVPVRKKSPVRGRISVGSFDTHSGNDVTRGTKFPVGRRRVT